MLGLGHSLVAGSALGGYENNFGLKFDGTNDGALAGISGNSPANGTIKPLSPSGFTIACWCKLDIDGESDPYINTGSFYLVSTQANGGFNLQYNNRSFQFGLKLVDGDGNTTASVPKSTHAMMKNPLSSAVDQPKQFLHKPDGWHFVVGTWDGDRVKNLYVDGGRDQAGSQTVISEGVGNFGSQPEDSDSKKTEGASSGGAWTIKYDDTADRKEVDVSIGAAGSFNSGSDVTTLNAQFWEGYIGDVGIWDKELTSAEVTTLYNLHRPIDFATVQPDNLQGHWKMEEGSGTVFVESTGNVGTDGTISGATFDALAPSLDVSGYPGYA